MKALLINPWIYDFTAFDLWSKPLGLLYIGSLLDRFGIEVSLIDTMDRNLAPGGKRKDFGTGKYLRTKVEKPKILEHVPRYFARYGMKEDDFIERLKANSDADIVLMTSIMTYWYPGVLHAANLIREHLPGKPIILGGIYASLLPGHAEKHIRPDYLIEGPGEMQILKLLEREFGYQYDKSLLPQTLDDYPNPAFWLYPKLDYLVIMTSRGCPYNCSFCAQKRISMPFQKRSPEKVIDEIIENYRHFGARDFAFYDDALFIESDNHIKPILRKIIELDLPLRFHTPNGLFAGMIDDELADLLYRANFKTMRLSFETSNENRRKDMAGKVTNQDMADAVEILKKAGYKPYNIDAYVLMDLPNQDVEEVIESMKFVNRLGVKLRLASFSPIHGTAYFDKAVQLGLIPGDIDPLLTNKSIFPLSQATDPFEKFTRIRNLGEQMNLAAEKGEIFDG
ncbi:MAG: B12-binding domain-containing radical SAM protein [Candidatus Zixiibacteriota bacterium]